MGLFEINQGSTLQLVVIIGGDQQVSTKHNTMEDQGNFFYSHHACFELLQHTLIRNLDDGSEGMPLHVGIRTRLHVM